MPRSLTGFSCPLQERVCFGRCETVSDSFTPHTRALAVPLARDSGFAAEAALMLCRGQSPVSSGSSRSWKIRAQSRSRVRTIAVVL